MAEQRLLASSMSRSIILLMSKSSWPSSVLTSSKLLNIWSRHILFDASCMCAASDRWRNWKMWYLTKHTTIKHCQYTNISIHGLHLVIRIRYRINVLERKTRYGVRTIVTSSMLHLHVYSGIRLTIFTAVYLVAPDRQIVWLLVNTYGLLLACPVSCASMMMAIVKVFPDFVLSEPGITRRMSSVASWIIPLPSYLSVIDTPLSCNGTTCI